jgi:hypothetical protein
MWQYAVLAALLIGGGVAIGMTMPEDFSAGGWFTAAALLAFAAVVWRMHATEARSEPVVSPKG